MPLSVEIIKKWRWDLIGIGFTAASIWVLFTPPSAYFLHVDTLNQDVAALEWSRNCWIFATEKMLPVFLLGISYRLFGAATWHEMVFLGAFHMLSVLATFELARQFSNSRIAGLTAALLLMALPAFEFFSRTYLGYITPLLLLAWLAVHNKRWGWAGLCFGLAMTAHFYIALILIALSVVVLGLLNLRPTNWQMWLRFCMGIVAPLLAVEAWFFIYMGHVYAFVWISTIWKLTFRQVDYVVSLTDPKLGWTWLPQTLADSNGIVLSLTLALGLLSPLSAWRRRNKTSLAFCLTSISIIAVLGFQAVLGRGLFFSKTLAPFYPFWAIGTSLLTAEFIGHINRPLLKQIAVGAICVVLVLTVIQTGAFIRQFTQTPYPTLEQWMKRIAESKRPLRYAGPTIMFPLYVARLYGVELLVGYYSWITENAPGQAVLIFQGHAPAHVSQENYTITVAEVNTALDSKYPALTYAAYEQQGSVRRVELWWPALPSQSIKPDQPKEASNVEFYYAGSGCSVKPVYINKSMHFYQLVWFKLATWLGIH